MRKTVACCSRHCGGRPRSDRTRSLGGRREAGHQEAEDRRGSSYGRTTEVAHARASPSRRDLRRAGSRRTSFRCDDRGEHSRADGADGPRKHGRCPRLPAPHGRPGPRPLLMRSTSCGARPTRVLIRVSAPVWTSQGTGKGMGRARRPVSDADRRCLRTGVGARFAWPATLFAVERVTGIEPALSAWELLEPLGMCLVPCEFRGPERPGVSLGCPP